MTAVGLVLQDELHSALGERHLAGKRGKSFISKPATDARRLKQVLQVMDLVRFERSVEHLHVLVYLEAALPRSAATILWNSSMRRG